MLDRAKFWTPTAPVGTQLTGDGITVRLLPAIEQVMLSGDLTAGLARFDLSESLGLMAQASGPRYALRLARGRVLIVGAGVTPSAAGWQDGVATTPMTGALAVFEISGPMAMELLARATAIDLRKPSPCAALNFAGVTSILYQHEAGLRLHLDAGLAPYMLDWMRESGLF